jgi:hypothetical protein
MTAEEIIRKEGLWPNGVPNPRLVELGEARVREGLLALMIHAAGSLVGVAAAPRGGS